MNRIEFNQPWTLTFTPPGSGAPRTIPAQVPGNVLGDLHRAGIIPDPYFGCNSNDLRPYEFIDWEYRTEFDAPVYTARETLRLVFEGVDTIAEVLLNGKRLGTMDNMFTEHRFDIDRNLLRAGRNELVVRIQSSMNYARTIPLPAWCHTTPYSYAGLPVRRALHTYGWDIAPRLVGAGIWRNVYLEVLAPERWTELYLATADLTDNFCRLGLNWNFVSDNPALIGYEGRVTLVCRDKKYELQFPLYFTTGTTWLEPENPYLWFPAGSGEPNLYTVTLELLHDGEVLDTRVWKTGIRTIELVRTEQLDADGNGEFVFKINGRKIFIKGANWVPYDALYGENRDRVLKSLALFSEANCNMVRCWGGGVYEGREFFDYCDEHGLLVWQDFMFALEMPLGSAEFLESVRREAEEVIIERRNHASLALWCGDNECDTISLNPLNKRLMPSDNPVSRDILPRAVKMFDPMRDYLPSSPYFSDAVKTMNNENRMPEQHLWGPRDSWKGHFFLDNTAIFASETGYHGMPHADSVRKFIPEAEWNNREGDSWLCHAAQQFNDRRGPCATRNRLMENQTLEFWGTLPENLEDFMKCSQIVQAEALKSIIEIFRRKKWNKTGVLWWNVIDCWPQFSDSVVDYYYVRKLAFYYIRNAQKPLSLILSGPEGWNLTLTASNDAPAPASGHCRIFDALTGEVFFEGRYSVGAESACDVASFRFRRDEQRMLLAEWDNGDEISYNHYLTGAPPFRPEQYLAYLKELDEKIYRALGRHEW